VKKVERQQETYVRACGHEDILPTFPDMMREWRGVAKEKRRATGGYTEEQSAPSFMALCIQGRY
jgi:hypothetical protein